MRLLFLVGAKLLGIYFIIQGLIEGSVLLVNPASAAPFANQLAVSCLVLLVAGTVLAFATGLVALGLRIPEATGQTPSLSSRSALEVGIILLGLWQLLVILPQLLLRVNDYFQQFSRTRNPADLVSRELIVVAAALGMMCFPRRIAAFLARESRQSSVP